MNGPGEPMYECIGDICDVSDNLALTDPKKAIRFLEGFRQRDDFHPWGDFFILRHAERVYEQETRLAERELALNTFRQRASDFMDVAPGHQAAWPIVLRAAQRTGHYRPLVIRLAEQLHRTPALESPWLVMTIVECLLNMSPAEGRLIADKALAGGVLSADMVTGARRLASFLTELREALAILPPQQTWGFEFGAGPMLRGGRAGSVYINISRLGLTRIEAWLQPLSAPFFNALFALFGWREPVFDDVFLENWATMSGGDSYHGLFVQLIQPLLPRRPPAPPKPVRLMPAVPRPGELWVRAGNGQLWALRSYLDDLEESCRAAQIVAETLRAGDVAKLRDMVDRDPWWPRCDPVTNVARIVLNAGWYAPPETAGMAFRDWAERYRRALERGNLLSGHAHMYLPLVPLLPALKTKQLAAFVPECFVKCLDGARVVFATAFAPQIEAHFHSGNVHALWSATGADVRLRALTCVEPPISVWPHRPHMDWSASFGSLVAACETAIRATQADVFMAACGSYGLPLVEEIHRRTGISCFYPGHVANMLFGIYTDTFRTLPFYNTHRSLPYWINGRLAEAYPEIAGIDHGRYVAASQSIGGMAPGGGG